MGSLNERHSLAVSIVALFTLIPVDLFLAFGFTFSFTGDEPFFWGWAFVWTAFFLDAPAVLISFFAPKIGAWFLSFNAVASFLMSFIFLAKNAIEAHFRIGTLALARTIIMLVAFWGVKALFIWLLIRLSPGKISIREEANS